jgi:nucleotide-binding universal stress UspA family protein
MSDPAHLAVACALSPRLRGVLAEASRFAGLFDARVSILHAGARSETTEKQFATAIGEAGLPAETPVHWAAGEPAAALSGLADEQSADILAAGALERDVEMQFLSGVARGLLRSARCSLVLFTKPSEQPQPFRRIVVLTDFTPAAAEALRLALHVAEREKVEVLHVLSVFTPFTAARAKLGTEDEGPARHERDEEGMLADFVSGAADSPVPIETRIIHTTTGMGASDFTKTIEADLLVVPAETTAEGETRLPTSMDWVMQVIPCNLWVVKQPPASKA